MKTILGIDPGLAKCGWGIISKEGNHLKYVASDVISSDPEERIELRLKLIFDHIDQVIKQYAPSSAAMEETFVNVNSQSSLKLAHVRGAIMVAVAAGGISFAQYAPNLVKKSIVGYGRAEKNQVIHMIGLLLPGSNVKRADEADALAVALCHSSHTRFL